MKFAFNTLISLVFVSIMMSAVLIDTWQFWILLLLWLFKEYIVKD